MRPDFNLKICRILLVTLVFLSFTGISFSQTKDNLNFTYKVETVKAGETSTYNIIVSVSEGNGPFVFELCDKSFPTGGVSLIKTSDINSRTYKFSNLQLSDYYIYVYTSNQEMGRGKKVIIK